MKWGFWTYLEQIGEMRKALPWLFFCRFCKIQCIVFWSLVGMGFDGSLSKKFALQGQGQGPSSIFWAQAKGMCWLVCPYNPTDGEAETAGSWESCSASLVSCWPPAKALSQNRTCSWELLLCSSYGPIPHASPYAQTTHTHTCTHTRMHACTHKHTTLKYAFHETSLYFSSKEAECQFLNMYVHKNTVNFVWKIEIDFISFKSGIYSFVPGYIKEKYLFYKKSRKEGEIDLTKKAIQSTSYLFSFLYYVHIKLF